MTRQFVKFTPDVEAADPQFDEKMRAVIEATERYIADSVAGEGIGRAVRDAHAKGYGLVRGEVEILDGLPAEYAQGIYATPGRHDALVRFSNGSPHTGADAGLGAATGLSLKIFDIDGQVLLEDESDTRTFDYANINAPIFFANSIDTYLFIQDLFIHANEYLAEGAPGRHRLYKDFVTGKGTLGEDEWVWEEFLAFMSLASLRPQNVLLSTYWTMGAVRHGDYIAKVRMAPVPAFAEAVVQRDLEPWSAPEVYRPALVAELRDRPYEFDIQVQLCTDLARMPVENLTVEWPERLSPVRHGGQATVPTAGHLRRGQPREDGRAVFLTVAGHGRSSPPWQHDAEPQGGLPSIVHPASQAQQPGASRAPHRRRDIALVDNYNQVCGRSAVTAVVSALGPDSVRRGGRAPPCPGRDEFKPAE
jgi:hypothetical protein